MTFTELINNATKTNREYIATIPHEDRLAIIDKLKSFKRGWTEDCKVESTNNTWYLFANYLNGFTISISTGEDSIFDDVIVNGR